MPANFPMFEPTIRQTIAVGTLQIHAVLVVIGRRLGALAPVAPVAAGRAGR